MHRSKCRREMSRAPPCCCWRDPFARIYHWYTVFLLSVLILVALMDVATNHHVAHAAQGDDDTIHIPCQGGQYSIEQSSRRYRLSGNSAEDRCNAPDLELIIQSNACANTTLEILFVSFNGTTVYCPNMAMFNVSIVVEGTVFNGGGLWRVLDFANPRSIASVSIQMTRCMMFLQWEQQILLMRASDAIDDVTMIISGSTIRNQLMNVPITAEQLMLVQSQHVSNVLISFENRTVVDLVCAVKLYSSFVLQHATTATGALNRIQFQGETTVSIYFSIVLKSEARYKFINMQFFGSESCNVMLENAYFSIAVAESDPDISCDVILVALGEAPNDANDYLVMAQHITIFGSGKGNVLIMDFAAAVTNRMVLLIENVTATGKVLLPPNGIGSNLAQFQFLSFKNHRLAVMASISLIRVTFVVISQRSHFTEQHTVTLLSFVEMHQSTIQVVDCVLNYTSPAPSKLFFSFTDLSLIQANFSENISMVVRRTRGHAHFLNPPIAVNTIVPVSMWAYLAVVQQGTGTIDVLVEDCSMTTIADSLVTPPTMLLTVGAVGMGRVNLIAGVDATSTTGSSALVLAENPPYGINQINVTILRTNVTAIGSIRQANLFTGFLVNVRTSTAFITESSLQMCDVDPGQSFEISFLERKTLAYFGYTNFLQQGSSLAIDNSAGRNVAGLTTDHVTNGPHFNFSLVNSELEVENNSVPVPRALVIADVFSTTVNLEADVLRGFTRIVQAKAVRGEGRLKLSQCSYLNQKPIKQTILGIPASAVSLLESCFSDSTTLSLTRELPRRDDDVMPHWVDRSAGAVVALAGGAVGSVLVTTISAASLQRSLALLRVAQCDLNGAVEEPLDMASSPTRLSIGEDAADGAHLKGAILGNSLIMVGCFLANCVVAVATRAVMKTRRTQKKNSRKSWSEACSVASFPSLCLPVVSALLPPTVSSVTSLLVILGSEREDGETRTIDTLSVCFMIWVLLVGLVVLAWALWVVFLEVVQRRHAEAVPTRKPRLGRASSSSPSPLFWLRHVCSSLMIEQFRWRGTSWLHHQSLVGQHGGMFTAMARQKAWWAFAEWVIAILGGILGGVLSDNDSTCTTMVSLNVALSFVVLILLVWVRPYNVLLDGYLSIASAACACMVSVAVLAEANPDVLEAFVFLQAVVSSLGLALWVGSFLWLGGTSTSRLLRIVRLLWPRQSSSPNHHKERDDSSSTDNDDNVNNSRGRIAVAKLSTPALTLMSREKQHGNLERLIALICRQQAQRHKKELRSHH